MTALILLSTVMITLSALIPQSFMTSAADMGRWRGEYPYLSRAADALGLHRLYTHPAFAAVLGCVVISLSFSSIDQVRASLRRTFHPDTAFSSRESVHLQAGREAISPVLRSRGYLPMARRDNVSIYMRHPWGHWGISLLHVGMAVAIASSLVIALTQQRGLAHLIEGETHSPSTPWFSEENGIAAGSLVLPFAVRLDRLAYSFRPNYGVKDISSDLTFLTADAGPVTETVAINAILQIRDIRIHQAAEFGHAFYVEVRSGSGEGKVIPFLISHPRYPSEAGYNDFRDVMPPGDLLRAKYYVDEEKRSFSDLKPLLVLRIDRHGRELGQVPLRTGESGSIGTSHFRLIRVSPWTRLIFSHITGITGVFTGFFIIVLGGILYYFTPPREVLLSDPEGGGTQLIWRSSKFADFYHDEYRSLVEAIPKGEEHG